ncbi:sensor histidine kinase [Dokdonella sp.]|uniref:HAMP domain-containing sensor histidine kinase n=1 Tax=Dokdonella sp. TaxID=2291710 RepID=UPI001B091A13|nr:sensor histidine kinase [Dokdonella sp.]MBO9663199.1 sensor histidine kinase [Dokdonella sp.]
MSSSRRQRYGLVFKLALFYLLLSLPTLILVESTILIVEFHSFMRGVADGSLRTANERGAAELATRWHGLAGANTEPLQVWTQDWTLRLQQPRGGLTPDESYVLLELADQPLAAALLAPDGQVIARSIDDPHWKPELPSAEEIARTARSEHAALDLAGDDSPYKIRRSLAPVRDADGRLLGLLFVELRLPLPWRRLLLDSSYESPTVLAFLIVFGVLSSIFLAAWVTRRLNRIAGAATAWSRGDFSERIDDPSRDEIGRVSALLDSMALDLRRLLRSRAQLATLAERQRLARDLHDTVKQKAFALNLQLATARRLLADAPGAERLELAQKLTQQIQQELGQILDELRSDAAELPLAERLRARAIDWSHSSGIVPSFELEDMPALAPRQEESLLRIVDEALANVLRHAGATRVAIALRREGERWSLTVSDDGRGSDHARAAGMGLNNMRERAEALPQGRFRLDSAPGNGTRIAVGFVVADNPEP